MLTTLSPIRGPTGPLLPLFITLSLSKTQSGSLHSLSRNGPFSSCLTTLQAPSGLKWAPVSPCPGPQTHPLFVTKWAILFQSADPVPALSGFMLGPLLAVPNPSPNTATDWGRLSLSYVFAIQTLSWFWSLWCWFAATLSTAGEDAVCPHNFGTFSQRRFIDHGFYGGKIGEDFWVYPQFMTLYFFIKFMLLFRCYVKAFLFQVRSGSEYCSARCQEFCKF